MNAFLDHAFSGQVTFGATGFGTRIVVELTFADILLLETGERSKLAALGDYICLRTADGRSAASRSCSTAASRWASRRRSCRAAVRFWPERASPWLFPTSAAAVGFLAFALRFIVRDRQQLFGYRLAAARPRAGGVPLDRLAAAAGGC